ncbi:MAG: hypothetical protein ACJ8D5_07755 [Sphingomicrobium sp.]
MFEGWGEYFFMIGSSAAALIGLMFVVVSLTAGRDRSQLEQGKHFYTSPIVWHLGTVLLLSGGAIAPTMSPMLYGIAGAGLALLGIGMGVRSAVGIARAQLVEGPDKTFDVWWYGIVPGAVYVVLGAASGAVLLGSSWAASAIAAALMALLLVSIHAEWDLVTFLAPGAGQPGDSGNP